MFQHLNLYPNYFLNHFLDSNLWFLFQRVLTPSAVLWSSPRRVFLGPVGDYDSIRVVKVGVLAG
jgi:hypothetical protein